jgi:hypothetical protein
VASGSVSDLEFENDSDLQPGSPKRYKPSSSGGDGGSTRKLSGAARYKTKFQHAWQECGHLLLQSRVIHTVFCAMYAIS